MAHFRIVKFYVGRLLLKSLQKIKVSYCRTKMAGTIHRGTSFGIFHSDMRGLKTQKKINGNVGKPHTEGRNCDKR